MNDRSDTRPFAIIGVVGKTFSRSPLKDGVPVPESTLRVIQQAEQLGRLITSRGSGHAVLTGGHYDRRETSVKYFALKGAIDASETTPARLIGILPKDISQELQPSLTKCKVESFAFPNKPATCLYVHTLLEGDERDKITGETADVLIALEGTDGTAREVTAAIEAGRPVIFLNSLGVLEPRIKSKLKVPNKFPSPPVVADSPETAVEEAFKAIAWDTSSRNLSQGCPFMSEEFERSLQRFIAANQGGVADG